MNEISFLSRFAGNVIGV